MYNVKKLQVAWDAIHAATVAQMDSGPMVDKSRMMYLLTKAAQDVSEAIFVATSANLDAIDSPKSV